MQVLRHVLAGNFDHASKFTTGMGGLRSSLQSPEVRQELLSLVGQGLAKLVESTTSGYARCDAS